MGGKGICDRSSGTCDCFDGFTGKACGYQTCPNDCSGHGTCEFIEELTVGAAPGDYYGSIFTGFHTKSPSLSYVSELWDYGKSRACVCDPTYTEVDCSRKMCPKGNDVLDTRMDTTDKLLYQVQNVTFQLQSGEKYEEINSNATFSLTFKSTINETFTTIPIKFQVMNPERTSNYIESALLALPNGVIDGVSVNSTTIDDNAGHTVVSFLVYFTGA